MSSDNFLCDEQSVLEKATTALLHALGGVNIVWGVGQLETEFTLSMEQAIIDNELAGTVLRAQRGIEVTDETIAENVIRDCAATGDFLSHEHTLTHFREEHIDSRLAGPQRRETWAASGSPTLGERAADRVQEILSGPKEPCLTPDQAAELQKIENKWMQQLTGG